MLVNVMKMIVDKIRIGKTLLILLVFTLMVSFVNGQSCESDGNALEPGEYCDPSGEIFFDGVGECGDLYEGWEGELICGDNCQIDLIASTCDPIDDLPPGAEECSSCDDCDDIDGVDCSFELCTFGCDENCHYDPGGPFEVCELCEEDMDCGDYGDPRSCSQDVCQANSNNGGFSCEWIAESGRCVENRDCQWDCSEVYGACSGGFKNKQGQCELINGNAQECNANNPTFQFPARLPCGGEERQFPVFTWFNVLISSLLLIGYYTIFRRKD